MLEAIGGITLFFIALILLIKYIENHEFKKKEDEELIQANERCQKLIRDFELKNLINTRCKMTYEEVMIEVKKIIKDPVEREKTRDIIRRRKKEEKEDTIALLKERIDCDRKYNEFVKEVFNNQDTINISRLIDSIKNRYGFDDEQAKDLYHTLVLHSLVRSNFKNKNYIILGEMFLEEYRNKQYKEYSKLIN
ncbi:hypothetical protein ACFLSY_05545 [Bacteroidota bacterium]